MSEILLLTTAPCEEQTARAEEIGRVLSDSRGVTAKTVELFRSETENGRPLPRRVLKKQIADAVPIVLKELLRSHPSAVCCMHYAAAIVACEALYRADLHIPVFAPLRIHALLIPETAVRVFPAEPSELAASAEPLVASPPTLQESGRKSSRRISRALKFATKQEKLIRKYPFLAEEHLEWEL